MTTRRPKEPMPLSARLSKLARIARQTAIDIGEPKPPQRTGKYTGMAYAYEVAAQLARLEERR